jgi:tRNA(fMet)-specific endonuclease VapC
MSGLGFMVCFDTDFVIALIRRDSRAERKLEEYVIGERRISTTPITACELFKGAYRSKRRKVEVEKVRGVLMHVEILDFSADACERYGKLENELLSLGTPIGDLDAMIASLALTHNEPLLTANKKHFEKVPGLIVETW